MLRRGSDRVQAEWKVFRPDPGETAQLSRLLGLHPAIAAVLSARGWRPQACGLDEFLSPALRQLRPPTELYGMEAAVERTLRAIAQRENVWVYGDYDVDGVTSTALMVSLLRFLGLSPKVFIPHRIHDGYGMTTGRVEEIARDGCTLLITVDTGVTALEPIRRARDLGMDVIVTDHHRAGDVLPEAVALVNPNRPDALYEATPLCGVGVAFKFAHALLKGAARSEAESKRFLLAQLDLVALGTIADVVPLLGENRVFARFGLPAIMESKRPGLRALLEVAQLRPQRQFSPDLVSFGLGPRLNAAGRTDSAGLALELLLTNDGARAQALARELDGLNRERRRIEDDILGESLAEADSLTSAGRTHALVVGGEGWHLGVVGIVASRLVDRFHMPAIVLAIEAGIARGSARSINGFDLHGALDACSGHLIGFGGHASAAGLRLHAGKMIPFREALNDHTARAMADLPPAMETPVDGEVGGKDLTWRLYDDLQRLQPFGEGNPEPVFLMRGVRTRLPARTVGRNGDHLKFAFEGDGCQFDGIGFSLGPMKEMFDSGPADILVRPIENVFNGSARLEVRVLDARPAEAC